MIDWKKIRALTVIDEPGKMAVGYFDGRWWYHIYTGTLTLALLKALAWQEGIEVK